MDLGKREVKSMYSPLTIFSLILAGMGGKAGCGSDGVGSDVVIPDEQGGLGCIEDLIVAACVRRGGSVRTCIEAAERRSSSIASGCVVLGCVASTPVLFWAR